MADYYPLIARAVNGLDKSTGEARRALYDRAREALVTQLHGVEPALSESDITRERLALEEAIRKVEGEAARRPRPESPEPRSSEPESPGPQTSERKASPKERDSRAPASPAPRQGASEARKPAPPPREPASDSARMAQATQELSGQLRRLEKKSSGEQGSLVEQGLKGFRDVVAKTNDLGGKSASASKPRRETREAFAGLPPAGRLGRPEPRLPPQDLTPSQEVPPPRPRPEPRIGETARVLASPGPEEFDEGMRRVRPGRGRGLRKVVAFAVLLALATAAFLAYRAWESSITAMFQSTPVPTTQTSKEAAQTRPKIADRIGGAQDSTRPAAGPGAAVAQRAVLYEQQANPQERKQYVGSVIWRTETTSPGPGLAPDTAVKAEVDIPERQMRMAFIVRRNLDKALPVSHTIEIVFSTPADFQPGGIADVAGVLMEDNEQAQGAQLIGSRVKVTNGFFLVGLSPAESDLRRNVLLFKERPWVNLRIAYENGQRAVLAIEKGIPGDRTVQEALKAWGQTPPER